MALFVLSLCPFDISVGVVAFVIGLGQISSFLYVLIGRINFLIMTHSFVTNFSTLEQLLFLIVSEIFLLVFNCYLANCRHINLIIRLLNVSAYNIYSKTFRWYKTLTVNVVILLGENFAKILARHFMWGKFSRSYFLHKGIWVLFSRGSNFCEEDKSAKNAKIPPRENCHVFSTSCSYT